eukprot:6198594-Pleurochrysis_carterae.AAC.2
MLQFSAHWCPRGFQVRLEAELDPFALTEHLGGLADAVAAEVEAFERGVLGQRRAQLGRAVVLDVVGTQRQLAQARALVGERPRELPRAKVANLVGAEVERLQSAAAGKRGADAAARRRADGAAGQVELLERAVGERRGERQRALASKPAHAGSRRSATDDIGVEKAVPC